MRVLDNGGEAQYTDAVFTGLIEAKGVLRARTTRRAGVRVEIATALGPLNLGESVSVQGVCLTAHGLGSSGFEADVSAETVACSTLGAIPIGHAVNLERAVVLGGRMGGHIVTGHVDDRARLRDRRMTGETFEMTFAVDPSLARFIASKGSVAIDGVSLTVNRASRDEFDIIVIPHTLDHTTLADLDPGQDVNIEVDVLARYVARILESPAPEAGATADQRMLDTLKSAGFIST
jgi:riboflavin synthase